MTERTPAEIAYRCAVIDEKHAELDEEYRRSRAAVGAELARLYPPSPAARRLPASMSAGMLDHERILCPTCDMSGGGCFASYYYRSCSPDLPSVELWCCDDCEHLERRIRDPHSIRLARLERRQYDPTHKGEKQ